MRKPASCNTPTVMSTPSTPTPPFPKEPGLLEDTADSRTESRKEQDKPGTLVLQVNNGHLTSYWTERLRGYNEKNTKSVTFWPKMHKLDLIMQNHWPNPN